MMIEYRNVTVNREGQRVLDNINLSISEGDFVYLMGRVGCGKSTLLKTIYGEIGIEQGTAMVLDFDMRKIKANKLPLLRRQIGVIFQDFLLMTDRSVFDNLDFVLRATGWKKKSERRSRIDEVLSLVGMTHKENIMPFALSGGEQQRICIARALLNYPRLILADEPTGNLDADNAYQVAALLHDIATNNNTSVIFSTHNESIIEDFPGRVLVIENQNISS